MPEFRVTVYGDFLVRGNSTEEINKKLVETLRKAGFPEKGFETRVVKVKK